MSDKVTVELTVAQAHALAHPDERPACTEDAREAVGYALRRHTIQERLRLLGAPWTCEDWGDGSIRIRDIRGVVITNMMSRAVGETMCAGVDALRLLGDLIEQREIPTVVAAAILEKAGMKAMPG